ncbi:MAG: tetrahydrofolate dehydrogenase/cyclohydrolase catalytic domain-containing protein, partial [Ilumatobacteraceae bacterium]
MATISDPERTAGGAILLDGNRLRDETVASIASRIMSVGSPAICLATVLVGSDGPSGVYVRMKHRKATEAGMVSRGVELPDSATQAEVEQAVAALVDDPTVHGILVQLPLPGHLDPEPVLALLPPAKDVDGLTDRSLGRLVRDLPGHVPCTPLGVMRL